MEKMRFCTFCGRTGAPGGVARSMMWAVTWRAFSRSCRSASLSENILSEVSGVVVLAGQPGQGHLPVGVLPDLRLGLRQLPGGVGRLRHQGRLLRLEADDLPAQGVADGVEVALLGHGQGRLRGQAARQFGDLGVERLDLRARRW